MYSIVINLDILRVIEIVAGAFGFVATTSWIIATSYARVDGRIRNLEKTTEELKVDYKELIKQNYVVTKSIS